MAALSEKVKGGWSKLAGARARTLGCGVMVRPVPCARGVLFHAAVLAAGGGALLLLPDAHMFALQAAGAFKGQAIGGISHFVSALKGNLIWLGGTAMGLIIAVVGIMFLAGHSRAHDVALKTVIGLAILASVGGIVA